MSAGLAAIGMTVSPSASYWWRLGYLAPLTDDLGGKKQRGSDMTAMISDSSSGAHVLTPSRDVAEAYRVWMAAAFMLGAIARDMLGDADAVGRVLQRALHLTEPDQVLPPFLIHPPPRLARPGPPTRRFEALSYGEIRVLRYLQTNLSAPEIAGELSVSVNTVKTHQRHLYQKLGAHSRTQAVEQARALGLLLPSARRR